MTNFLVVTTHYMEMENLYGEFWKEFQEEKNIEYYRKDCLIVNRKKGIILSFLYLNTPQLGLISRGDKIDFISVLRNKNILLEKSGEEYLEIIDNHIENGTKLITIEQMKEIIKGLLKQESD